MPRSPPAPLPANFLRLLILLLFANLAFSHIPHHPHPATSSHFIVTFLSYQPATVHHSTLRTVLALTPPTTWRLLSRHNTAALHLPTDFLLLDTTSHTVISILRSNPTIRSITPQNSHFRLPKAIRLPTDFSEPDAPDLPTPRPAPSRHPFSAGSLWRRGFTGQRVSVAVFDTGLISDHTHFRNIASISDWTAENTTLDHVGHGTFVAGLIAGTHPSCPGLAPDVNLHIFRVFTAAQVSYTSWFLDAFNYALHLGIDVLNLSIGGPDFADTPFTEKVDELAAHGVIIVSAIGNDGPLWGSLNNPGDMMAVVGVGGAEPDGRVASFSSRGMTTHELDYSSPSYGRVKPDIVAYARSLVGPSHRAADRCRRLSGTSVASPVVAGAIALLASAIPLSRRRRVINPASVKRALIASSRSLHHASIYEQGAGLLDIEDAYMEMIRIDDEFVQSDTASASTLRLSTRVLHSWSSSTPVNDSTSFLTSSSHGNDMQSHRRPVSVERLFSDLPEQKPSHAESSNPAQQRRRLFATGRTRSALMSGPAAAFFPAFYDLRLSACPHMWPHCAQPMFHGGMPVNLNVTILNPGGVQGHVQSIWWMPGLNGEMLNVDVSAPKRFWPWAAGMGIHLSVQVIPKRPTEVEGVLKIRIVSSHERTYSDVDLPIKATVVQPPAKKNRLLWDMQHSIRYPPGYVPRDNLVETKDMLDWLGDHPHTNFHSLFRELMLAGFYVDILEEPISCLGVERASQYGGLLIIDSEDYFSHNDTVMIDNLVKHHGMALIIAAEWYNVDIMREIRFEDDNTRSWWSPIMAGGNVPALNDLLNSFDIGFGDDVLSGDVRTGLTTFRFDSGVDIVKFPSDGDVITTTGMRLHQGKGAATPGASGGHAAAVMGLAKSGHGRVLVYGDSNCMDTAYAGTKCYSFFAAAVGHAIGCCGREECGKLAPLSHKMGMDNGIWQGGGLARGVPDEVMEVFRAHSRSGVRVERRKDGSVVVKVVGDDERQCMGRRDEVEKARVVSRGVGWERVHMPAVRRADPIGDERKYYGEVEGKAKVSERGRVGRGWGGIRSRALWLVIVGLGLMGVSISVRRNGKGGGRRSRGRRVGKLGGSRAEVSRAEANGGHRVGSLRNLCSS